VRWELKEKEERKKGGIDPGFVLSSLNEGREGGGRIELKRKNGES